MSDRVVLEGLELEAGIGVYEHERGIRQHLVVDVRVMTDVRAAAASDEIGLAVDYDALATISREVAASAHHALIETVAEQIAARVLADLGARVTEVWVRVAKPGAVSGARTVAVEITRR